MINLLPPDLSLLFPGDHPPAPDKAPAAIARGTPKWLCEDLAAILGEAQVLSRVTDLVRYATDASPYRLFPRVVVTPRNIDEVARIFAYAHEKQIPVTIRAAGTSLSGQSQGDGILIDARRHWSGCVVESGGRRLRARPGTILFHANLALKPLGFRLGPDPASANVCTVGGVIANNSSGMCCGTVQNSYQTIRSLSFLLPSGTFIDSESAGAEALFAAKEPELVQGLMGIKNEIEADEGLVRRLRKKFAIKNTTGYHMAAFLDGKTPLEIFRRLLVGSEGTLAFISEAVFETVSDDKHRLTGLLIFPDLRAACSAVAPFVQKGAAAVELLDRESLRAVENKPGVPERWKGLPGAAAALLVEFREKNEERVEAAASAARSVLGNLALLESAEFTRDPERAARYWTVRSGLLPSIGGARPSGTSLILEDVCFPQERLADGAMDLQALFAQHGYRGVVFGHASAGNLHFLITPSLNTDRDIRRFDEFLRGVISLVVDKYDGSLKAEHGTGRNIAPFVEREWGPKLTGMMWRIKRLADPHGILSPDVMLTEDGKGHLKHLHTVPTVEAEVDRCIECGYCEPVCPSRNLTTTPRQRIALRREMWRQPAESEVTHALLNEYEYDAIQTCAGDGGCQLACPVGINTGTLMKEFRHVQHGELPEQIALKVAQRWADAEAGARSALRLNEVAEKVPGGRAAADIALRFARSLFGTELVPTRLSATPPAASSCLPPTSREGAAAVYFHACVNRIFAYSGAHSDGNEMMSLAEALVAVSARAGLPLWIPDDLPGTCCSTVWHSKGYADANELMANRTVEKMWEWTSQGKIPVVCDASSCSLGLTTEVVPYLTAQNAARHARMKVIDSVGWAMDSLLPKLEIGRKVGSVAVHPVCSLAHLGLVGKLQGLAAALSEKATTPIHATCCAFAGDRGFLHPELTRSATSEEAAELGNGTFDRYVCSNRTCELGMTFATGKEYRSILFLLEELTRGEREIK